MYTLIEEGTEYNLDNTIVILDVDDHILPQHYKHCPITVSIGQCPHSHEESIVFLLRKDKIYNSWIYPHELEEIRLVSYDKWLKIKAFC